jgi:3-oxoacyl-[acyl-carrier-protein] synthase II
MTGVAVASWSTITSAGVGADALVSRLAAPVPADAVPVGSGAAVSGLYEEPLPSPRAHALADFDVRAHLGRRGTSSYDRATALAVVCCQDALAGAGLAPDGAASGRVGVALGTSLGSFKSTSDYTRETLVQEKPYLVNPMLFPNTVMNCAAGQVAIRLGLRGVNATIAGGALAFLNAVRYAANVIDRGYADVMLTGAVEEYTPHRAWAAHLGGAAVPAGEAAGVFVLTGTRAAQRTSPGQASILAVATGYGPGGGDSADRALAGCVDRVLARSGVAPADVAAIYTGEADEADRSEYGPAAGALGHQPRRVLAKRLLGECDAASGAVALAVALARGGHGELSLLTGRGPDGAVGAAIVRRCAGPDGTETAAGTAGGCQCPP